MRVAAGSVMKEIQRVVVSSYGCLCEADVISMSLMVVFLTDAVV